KKSGAIRRLLYGIRRRTTTAGRDERPKEKSGNATGWQVGGYVSSCGRKSPFETMEKEVEAGSGALGFVVNQLQSAVTTAPLSTQGVHHELRRHRPPQEDYHSRSAQPTAPTRPPPAAGL